jgi:hypothetical protein
MTNGLLEEAMPQDANQPAQEGGEFKISPEAQAIVDQAVEILYSPGEGNLENMVQMFQQHGPENFSTAMATAVLGLLDRLQQDNQNIPLEVLSEVGGKLFEIILQDIMEGGVIENISEQEVLLAQAKILEGWAASNAGSMSPEDEQSIAALVVELKKAAQGQQAQPGAQPPQGGEMPQGGIPPQGGM